MSLPCRVQVEQGEKVIIVAESKSQVNWRPRYAVLGGYFVLIILISDAISFLSE